MRGPGLLLLAGWLALAGCSAPLAASPTTRDPVDASAWPQAPAVPSGALPADVTTAIERLVAAAPGAAPDPSALATIAGSGDARLAWLLSDLLRMTATPDAVAAVVDTFERLTGADARDTRFGANAWLALTNLLIGWDLPAPPGYREHKSAMLLRLEPAWEPILADPDGTLDWRHVTWGGVFMDTRPSGSSAGCERACIPSLDDPALTSATEGGWYPDDRTVFGIELDGEAVAVPKHIMEVHELAHLTLAGRRIGIPYCTLCSSAHAFFVDGVVPGGEPLVLRTSGLLSRSNKVMVDLASGSAFYTFTGRAATGALREAGVVLEPLTVTVSTWGEWRATHPDTRIVARDGGIGRTYPDDPLCGRDDAGPIFPTGPADPRLPAQAPVIGAIAPDGRPVAFDVEAAAAALATGRTVTLDDVALHESGGLQATDPDGRALTSHQSSWFAWSQFHPSTSLWAPLDVSDRASGRTTAAEGCWDVIDPLER